MLDSYGTRSTTNVVFKKLQPITHSYFALWVHKWLKICVLSKLFTTTWPCHGFAQDLTKYLLNFKVSTLVMTCWSLHGNAHKFSVYVDLTYMGIPRISGPEIRGIQIQEYLSPSRKYYSSSLLSQWKSFEITRGWSVHSFRQLQD